MLPSKSHYRCQCSLNLALFKNKKGTCFLNEKCKQIIRLNCSENDMCKLDLQSRYTASSKLGNLRALYGWKRGEATKEEFRNTALASRGGARKIKAHVETWKSRARKSFYNYRGSMRTGNVFLGTWWDGDWEQSAWIYHRWILLCRQTNFGGNLAAFGDQGTVVDNVFLSLKKAFGTSTVLSMLGVCGGMVVSGGQSEG